MQAQIRADFTVLCQKVRYAHGSIRNKLNYRYINLLSVQNQPVPSKLCSAGLCMRNYLTWADGCF